MPFAKIDTNTLLSTAIKSAISREDLLARTDTYVINTFSDGLYDTIDCYQKGVLIHTSKANYDSVPNPLTGLPNLKTLKGFLFPEIFQASLGNQNASETAQLIASNATLNANSISSKILVSVGKMGFIQAAQATIVSTNILTVSLNNVPLIGNVLFACIGSFGNAVLASVSSINQVGVTWTKAKSNNDGVQATAEIWIGIVQTNANTTLTISYSQNFNYAAVDICEFSGLKGILDLTALNNGSSVNPDSGTTAPTTYTTELWVACLLNASSTNQTSPTNNFILLDGVQNGTPLNISFCYKIVTSIAAANVTSTSGYAVWVGCIATFT
jgi:hypothetical protein